MKKLLTIILTALCLNATAQYNITVTAGTMNITGSDINVSSTAFSYGLWGSDIRFVGFGTQTYTFIPESIDSINSVYLDHFSSADIIHVLDSIVAIPGAAAAGTLTGTTLAPNVVTTSITATGVVTNGTWGTGSKIGTTTMDLGSDASYDMYYRAANGRLARLANGGAGKRLTATATIPAWTDTVITVSGVYSPTIALNANLDAATATFLMYVRVGNICTVSGVIDFTPTNTGQSTSMIIPLPFASSFSTRDEIGGAGYVLDDGQPAGVEAEAAADAANLQLISGEGSGGVAQTVTFTFTYIIQ